MKRWLQRMQCTHCMQRVQCIQCIHCTQLYSVYGVYNVYTVHNVCNEAVSNCVSGECNVYNAKSVCIVCIAFDVHNPCLHLCFACFSKGFASSIEPLLACLLGGGTKGVTLFASFACWCCADGLTKKCLPWSFAFAYPWLHIVPVAYYLLPIPDAYCLLARMVREKSTGLNLARCWKSSQACPLRQLPSLRFWKSRQ